MASRRDMEHGPSLGEREPLLGLQQSEGDVTAPLRDDSAPEPQSEASKRREYGWRGFWIVVAILLVAVFVKGWVESDDVDVSFIAKTICPQDRSNASSQFDLKGALKRALGGGLSGAAAMVLQVLLLMPIRTIMNYQYRHGTSLTTAMKTLYQDGGYGRYYAGMGAALFQGTILRLSRLNHSGLIVVQVRSPALVTRQPTLVFWLCCSRTAIWLAYHRPSKLSLLLYAQLHSG